MIHITDDYTALLAAILADPTDDAPRLVLADWLEENGQEERAEFIRVQCELGRLSVCESVGSFITCTRKPECRYCSLNGRMGSLISINGRSACGARGAVLPFEIRFTQAPNGFRAVGGKSAGTATINRGFVSTVICHTADFMRHAKTLFERQPIEHVTLSDKRPQLVYIPGRPQEKYAWEELGDRHDRANTFPLAAALSAELFERMKLPRFEYPGPRTSRISTADTNQAAIDALSKACVAYGRSLAGLPPLQPVAHTETPACAERRPDVIEGGR